mgnify:CR=1 FL=1
MSSRQDKEALLRFLSRFPEIDPEAIGFAMRIHELVRQSDLDFDKYLEKDGLSASRFRVLEVLFLQEGHTLTPAELADRVYLTRGAVTPTELFGYAWESDAALTARLTQFIGYPDAVYLWRAPDEIIFDRSRPFRALYAARGLEEDILAAFYERSGRPVLGATRLVAAGTATNPPQPLPPR